MLKYGLLGEHLSHSYSPQIHKMVFEYLNLDASYELIEKNKDELKEMIDKLRAGEYQGYNVTIPYKIEIMQYLDEISSEAQAIGSVNTVLYRDGKVIGYNTDYYGFYNELLYYRVEIKNKNCYVLGTGGASLAIHKALIDLGGNVKYVSRKPNNSGTISYEELEKEEIDVIVNTTPVGMYPNVDSSPISEAIASKAKAIVDIIFNPRTTKLMSMSNNSYNGLLMLVGQAIKAEELWQGHSIDINPEIIMKEL